MIQKGKTQCTGSKTLREWGRQPISFVNNTVNQMNKKGILPNLRQGGRGKFPQGQVCLCTR